MTHPLTDKLCQDIIHSKDCSKYRAEYTHYFLLDYMRTAADWQLDRDSEWLKDFLTGSGAFTYGMANSIVEEFRKAMRPQEDN